MPSLQLESQRAGGAGALFVTLMVLTAVALLGTVFTDDSAFRFHGMVFSAAGLLSLIVMTMGLADGRFRADPARYSDGVVRAGVIATMFWGVIGMTVLATLAVWIAGVMAWR